MLILGYEKDGMDHDNTQRKVLGDMQARKLRTKHRLVPFQMYEHTFFGEVVSEVGYIKTHENACADRDAPTKSKKDSPF